MPFLFFKLRIIILLLIKVKNLSSVSAKMIAPNGSTPKLSFGSAISAKRSATCDMHQLPRNIHHPEHVYRANTTPRGPWPSESAQARTTATRGSRCFHVGVNKELKPTCINFTHHSSYHQLVLGYTTLWISINHILMFNNYYIEFSFHSSIILCTKNIYTIT